MVQRQKSMMCRQAAAFERCFVYSKRYAGDFVVVLVIFVVVAS